MVVFQVQFRFRWWRGDWSSRVAARSWRLAAARRSGRWRLTAAASSAATKQQRPHASGFSAERNPRPGFPDPRTTGLSNSSSVYNCCSVSRRSCSEFSFFSLSSRIFLFLFLLPCLHLHLNPLPFLKFSILKMGRGNKYKLLVIPMLSHPDFLQHEQLSQLTWWFPILRPERALSSPSYSERNH